MAERSIARRGEWWPGRRMAEWFDWLDWPGFPAFGEDDRMLRIEETRDDDTLVIRAEMPGIDPKKDVHITVRDRVVEIRAERREQANSEEKGTLRSEFRYGSFSRVIPLPEEAKEGDVKAKYTDGILEIRVPCAPPPTREARRVEVERT
jgi:HSP20 family protein